MRRKITCFRLKAAVTVSAVLSGCITVFAAAATDSLDFASLRMRIVGRDSTNRVVPTADALAEAGLFAEATELLHELASPNLDTGASSATASGHPLSLQWRISSGIDYYHLEDVDTVTMTPEELRDYKRLTETPLSIWLRAKTAIHPVIPSIEEIDPEVYVSERKGRFETTARLPLPGGYVRIEPTVKGEKWFRADASGESPFQLADTQPTDMGGAAFRLSVDNSTQQSKKINFNLPLAVDWEHYRSDRPGYESLVEYRLLPTLELQTRRVPISWRFSGQIEYEDYYREQSTTLDVVRISGRVDGTMRGDKRNGSAGIAWMGDRYTNATNPAAIDRFEGSFRGGCAVAGPLGARLRLRGIYETESGRPPSDSVFYNCSGTEFIACPGVILVVFDKRLHAGPELLYERRSADAAGKRFIWEARRAFEPGVRAEWSGGVIEASVRAAFRSENIAADFEPPVSSATDSRSFRGEAEISLSPFDILSIDLFADYQYRVYAPYGNKARVSDNLSISAGVTARW